jgi:heme exporter protein A
MLAGLSAPAEGEVRWNGVTMAPFAHAMRAILAFAGHSPALKDELTAEENLASLMMLAGERPDAASLRSALDAVALGPKRRLPARVLSQGQRRRIGLARLSLLKRPLWILDEPVTALDSAGIGFLADMVRRHLESGGVAVAATHAPLGLPESRVRSLALA